MNPNMHTGETMEEGDYSGASTDNTVTLSADMLGGVSAGKGDKIRFCVTSEPDEDGNITGYFEEDQVRDGKKWERGLKEKVLMADQPETMEEESEI
jgi:hypothetical protein